jgi:predicted aconitase
MQLTTEEENSMDGRYGSSLATAYKILVAIGEATEAERLVDIQWAHLSGVNYNTIGDAGTSFLENFSREARVRVKTTINPMGYDRTLANKLSQNFLTKQTSIVDSYERMGVTTSFSCIPYELFSVPKKTSVSFAESNAAIFSNSMLNLLTNKESALSALASSVTGKAPFSGLRVAEQRQASISIRPTYRPKTELDWGLLGINFEGIDQPDILSAKSLSAAMGTSGSCGMFTVGQKNGNQLIRYEPSNAMSVRDELNTSEDGDLIILGSPQLGMNDLSYLAGLLEGKKLSKDCMIFCAREVHRVASSRGIVNRLEKSGCRFFCDSCSCFTPLVDKKETDSAITNSVKAAYYLNRFNRVKVCLKNLKTIVDEFSA